MRNRGQMYYAIWNFVGFVYNFHQFPPPPATPLATPLGLIKCRSQTYRHGQCVKFYWALSKHRTNRGRRVVYYMPVHPLAPGFFLAQFVGLSVVFRTAHCHFSWRWCADPKIVSPRQTRLQIFLNRIYASVFAAICSLRFCLKTYRWQMGG